MTSYSGQESSKLSPGLASHLEHLKPGEEVLVIVLLRTRGAAQARERRLSPEEREAAVQAVKESGQKALREVDDILKRFDGQRLADSPDALGTVPIKATAPAIRALARSGKVKAIMEDQPIHLSS